MQGHGDPGKHDGILAEARTALEDADADRFFENAALLFEPFHDDMNAKGLLRRAVDVFPNDGRALFWLAKIAVHSDCDDRLGREYLEAALRREPDRAECLSLLVSLLMDAHEFDACRVLADRLIDHAEDWPLAHSLRAHLMERLGDLVAAEKGYLAALELIRHPLETVPDTYFERSITGRRAHSAATHWITERLNAVRTSM